ncbi:hypothetical protein M433DRAFT_147419 [Acidomyces richmondensis BFW]|nr:MAG: hypothetical protein FE78DRAFT_76274 [Acidomyces sp. 'richmondensis']KYG41736.1 hypothetical protein M433DRAFT_147419 [Acidomyces richmondensis BFW]
MTTPFFSQVSFAGTIVASAVGTYIALSPPNPNSESTVSTDDLIHSLQLTSKHITKIAVFPPCLLPNIPSLILRHGAQNSLDIRLIKSSSATAVPLLLILGAGIPLRLISYAFLGKIFTFALAEPDHLATTGIYQYVQHPSYTGLIIFIICNALLLGRPDGVEERMLRAEFGAQWERWHAATPRFLPWLF